MAVRILIDETGGPIYEPINLSQVNDKCNKEYTELCTTVNELMDGVIPAYYDNRYYCI